MIVPPVRNWFGSVRFEVFTNRWFVIGTWFGYLVRSYLVRYVVRKLGTMLFGSVRDRGFCRTNLVRNTYLVRYDFFRPHFFDLKNVLTLKKLCAIGYPNRTDFGPTYLVRNWFGPEFFNKFFSKMQKDAADGFVVH